MRLAFSPRRRRRPGQEDGCRIRGTGARSRDSSTTLAAAKALLSQRIGKLPKNCILVQLVLLCEINLLAGLAASGLQ
jgi:hypothetical protein